MPEQLDPAVAQKLADRALHLVTLTPGNKVLCTKGLLRECFVTLAQEAYAMGFLASQKEQADSLVSSGAAERPAWMDIGLDDANGLARHGFRVRPGVLRSLMGAGYRVLGDLCWVSEFELRSLLYIGRKTAREIRTAIREIQAR